MRRCYDEERALHANIGVERSQVTRQEVIEDDVEKASGQEEGPKKHFHKPWAELPSVSMHRMLNCVQHRPPDLESKTGTRATSERFCRYVSIEMERDQTVD